MQHDTAGDPISGVKWTRRTTEKIADELHKLGIEVCPNTVAKLLKQLNFKLRVKHKRLSRTKDPDRDAQFAYIAEQRAAFSAQGQRRHQEVTMAARPPERDEMISVSWCLPGAVAVSLLVRIEPARSLVQGPSGPGSVAASTNPRLV